MRKGIFYLLLFVNWVSFAQETPTVRIEADTTKIRIGEQIKFQITVDNADVGVAFGELQLDSLGKIEVVEAFDIDTLKNKLIKRYLLTSFDSGSYLIPKQGLGIWSQAYSSDSMNFMQLAIQDW